MRFTLREWKFSPNRAIYRESVAGLSLRFVYFAFNFES
jgi:hypothetical protein